MAGKDEKFIKFYTTNLLQSYDYQKMSLEEKGLYLHLLFMFAETTDGELIYDEKLLSRQCNVAPQTFRRVFSRIKFKFKFKTRSKPRTNSEQTPDKLGTNPEVCFYNPRMKLVVLERKKKSDKCSSSGALGAETTNAKKSANAAAISRRTPEDKDKDRDKERDKKQEVYADAYTSQKPPADGKPSAKQQMSCPYQQIVNLYHETLPTRPKVLDLTPTRKRYILRLWREQLNTLEKWRRFFEFVSKSDFLMGRVVNEGHPTQKFNLEWYTKYENFLKICEQKYHDTAPQTKKGADTG